VLLVENLLLFFALTWLRSLRCSRQLAAGEPQNVADKQALGQEVWEHVAAKEKLALGFNCG
jgi:hypothetical protein